MYLILMVKLTGMHDVFIENVSPGSKMKQDSREIEIDHHVDGSKYTASPFTSEKKVEMDNNNNNIGVGKIKHQMPPASVMTRLILIMVWRKLIRNPNTYSSLLGLIWSLVSYRYILSFTSFCFLF